MNSYRHKIAFPNGYTASIISHEYSYGGKEGLFEVAVIHGDEIVYDTPVTTDVEGFLTFENVADVLKQIEALPPK